MSIAILYEYPETDEMGIKLTAEDMGVKLIYIPFRKVSVYIGPGENRLRSMSKNYNDLLKETNVVLNRTQSKNRRLYAANVMETFGKYVLNSSNIEYLCFSKLRTLLRLWDKGVRIPKTLFIPCDSYDLRRDGGKVYNEEIIATLMQNELGNGNIVIKPDAGSHGMLVRLAKNKAELTRLLSQTETSIINPIGFIAQELIDKWFYDLRIIVYKEKGGSSYCYSTGLARAGFKDFRTNTYLGNMAFRVNLPLCVREASIQCGEALAGDDEAWVLALDAMPSVSKNKVVDDKYVNSEMDKLTPSFNVAQEIKKEKIKYSNFSGWNKKLEEAYKDYMNLDAYDNVKIIIEESLERNKENIYFHEINSCPEFWEQTRIIAGINVARPILKCALSVKDLGD